MSQVETKKWGVEDFWGLSYDYDPQWILKEEQKAIQKELMEVCRTVIRPQAVVSDQTYEFPRRSIDALASLGLLGLIVPKELGGRGQNHVCVAMVVETIARYGCTSTAMIFVMHNCAVANLLLHHHDNKQFQDLLKRLDKDRMLGTIILSDPATGGHTWFAMSSKTKLLQDGRFQLLRYCSWATSAGFADFYTVEVTSPNFDGNYMNESVFLMYKDEVRSRASEWSACGMRGNHSAPVICEAVLSPDRLVGPVGDFPYSGTEVVNPYFLFLSSACWNGVAMGCIDIAKNHVTNKRHFDRGMRVGDYPIIQDYVGKAIAETNACRMLLYGIAQGLDQVTDNSDWDVYKNESYPVMRRSLLGHWCFQVKIKAAANVNTVSDTMMNACGGTGYKSELGLERLLRDGRAGWVMGMSNEVLRQLVGQSALYGMQSVDLWCQQVDRRSLNSELRKLSIDEKLILADTLLREVQGNMSDELDTAAAVDENKVDENNISETVDVNNNNNTSNNNNIKLKLGKLNKFYDTFNNNNNGRNTDIVDGEDNGDDSCNDVNNNNNDAIDFYNTINNGNSTDIDGVNDSNNVDGDDNGDDSSNDVNNSNNDDVDFDNNINSGKHQLMKIVAADKHSYQDTEFDNPFNTSPPTARGPFISCDGTWHNPALKPDCYTSLKLTSVNQLNAQQAEYEFALPHPTDHTGCTPGQYIKVRVGQGGADTRHCERFFSPVSATTEFGKIALMLKYETNGELTKRFQAMNIGDTVEFCGPSGGLEYASNEVEHLSLLSSGGGCAPFIQIVRDVTRNPADQTKISMVHYSDRESEIIYRDEMEACEKDNSRLNLFYTVGQVESLDTWGGGMGYINSKMLSHRLPPPEVKSHKILICGGPSMVCSVLQDLFELGYSSKTIFVYGQFGVEQVRAIYGRHAKLSSHKLNE